MNRYAYNALRYFAEKGTLTNQHVTFQEDFNGKAYCGIEDKMFCGKQRLLFSNLKLEISCQINQKQKK